jgi:hypothetical protein
MSTDGTVHPRLHLDLGKTKKKRIKQLREGAGPLVAEIQALVEARVGSDTSGDVLPIVILFERKKKKSKDLGVPGLNALLPRLR